ncbi:hypothetical protein [Vibrio methylphosphonaticus]|uniref:hypothetical protein n=1 Tax=Vibrio methylphosphonaticus TaxID=2946866 RepID=UPI002029F4BE|nr:hypothetical protein [Vibrio methylphosphonaticus]MCL9773718.1 hypothetical protein [Vibrio methylphosphonaticus]
MKKLSIAFASVVIVGGTFAVAISDVKAAGQRVVDNQESGIKPIMAEFAYYERTHDDYEYCVYQSNGFVSGVSLDHLGGKDGNECPAALVFTYNESL